MSEQTENQVTTQAIIIPQGELNPAQTAQRIALFDEDGSQYTSGGMDPVEVITFTEDDITGPDNSWWDEGAVARHIMDFTPTRNGFMDLFGPIPLSDFEEGIEVQLFPAGVDPSGFDPDYDYESVDGGYADSYKARTNFPPEQFVPANGKIEIVDGGALEVGTTYQVWVASYLGEVGGQLDIGPIKLSLSKFDSEAAEYKDPYGDLVYIAGADKGFATRSVGRGAHAEGTGTYASAQNAHAEGSQSKAQGLATHAEGQGCIASGDISHAEGMNTRSEAMASHSEGSATQAEGTYSHAEGNDTHAEGESSHAEGWLTQASGNSSHAEGKGSISRLVGGHAAASSTLDPGNKQYERMVIQSDVNARLNSEGSGASLPANFVGVVRALVVARNTDTTIAAAWRVEMLVARNAAGTARVVGTPTKTIVAADGGASGWDLTLGFDTTGVIITPSGLPAGAFTVATVEFTEAGKS